MMQKLLDVDRIRTALARDIRRILGKDAAQPKGDAWAELRTPTTKEEAEFLAIVLLAAIHTLRAEWKLEEL